MIPAKTAKAAVAAPTPARRKLSYREQRELEELPERIDALERVVLSGAGVAVETYLDPPRLPRGGEGKLRIVVHARAPGRVAVVAARCRGQRAVPASSAQRPGLDLGGQARFGPDVEWIEEIEGVKFTNYMDWLRFAFLATTAGLPAISVPVRARP